MAAEESLASELSEVKEEVSQIAQELLSHREVLKELMEVRDGCMELLEHRDAMLSTFAQCLELREGIQAVLGAARLVAELGDKATELELSLAGVSDNTARHGKAISNLTEGHKRTQATLDAVVRAVKRLDRSRSRCRDSTPSSVRGAGPLLSARPPVLGLRAGEEPFDYGRPAGIDRPMAVEDWGAVAAGRPPAGGAGEADDAWTGPGWSAAEDQGATEEELRIGTGSSCGSSAEIRAARRAARARRPPSRGDAAQPGASTATPRDAGRAGSAAPASRARGGGDAGGAAAAGGSEMAHCVKGVLARIEEALTKLDGSGGAGGQEPTLSARALHVMLAGGGVGVSAGAAVAAAAGHRTTTPLPTARSLDPWMDPASASRGGGHSRRQRTPSRPQSASARRAAGPGGGGGGAVKSGPAAVAAAGYYSTSTPRRQPPDGDCPQDHAGGHGTWRVADSWA